MSINYSPITIYQSALSDAVLSTPPSFPTDPKQPIQYYNLSLPTAANFSPAQFFDRPLTLASGDLVVIDSTNSMDLLNNNPLESLGGLTINFDIESSGTGSPGTGSLATITGGTVSTIQFNNVIGTVDPPPLFSFVYNCW